MIVKGEALEDPIVRVRKNIIDKAVVEVRYAVKPGPQIPLTC